jgi:hypothetical protein
MGAPKINLASLQCPRCAGLTKLSGITRANDDAGSERFSFKCNECGAFEVLAITEPQEQPAGERSNRRERELQDLWA